LASAAVAISPRLYRELSAPAAVATGSTRNPIIPNFSFQYAERSRGQTTAIGHGGIGFCEESADRAGGYSTQRQNRNGSKQKHRIFKQQEL
jgi:hypothetical protein